MKLPFEHHPLIKEFNEIKRYFRKHETKVSKQRIGDFYRFSKILNQLGYEVAFDFVGSLNFGVTEQSSDVDFILYLGCEKHLNTDCDQQNCSLFKEVKFLILETLMKEYVKEPYTTQVVDCINLKRLDRELDKTENIDYDLVFRFAFYRSICRGVNLKILKPYHLKLLKRKKLLKELEPYIEDVIAKFNQTMTQNLSFEKYRIRLNEKGIKIPYSVIEKMKHYLYVSNHYTI
ncbi:MAG: hypothetical protein KatS3mg129_1704 [Leptospiraceae bacterium]|nr:MAG: hypothetical protein KatS3mg129_1704 [Leptospiraceae bacterium]